MEWTDQYSGRRYRVVCGEGLSASPGIVHVQNYADVLSLYAFHPEAKCADATGEPSGKETVGLHFPRHVVIEQVRFIGKEANEMEDVEAGLVHAAEDVVTEYTDPRHDYWNTVVRPAMQPQRVSLADLQRASGLSRRALIDARTGKRRPHRRNQAKIIAGLVSLKALK